MDDEEGLDDLDLDEDWDDEIATGPLDWRQFCGATFVGVEAALQEIGGIVGTWGRLLIGAHFHEEIQRDVHAQMTAELEQIIGEQL